MTQIIPDHENISEIAELREEIISKRESGEVMLEIKRLITISNFDRENIMALVDSFVRQLGFSGIGERWKQINRESAQKIFNFSLAKNLAYSEESIAITDAETIADRFMSLFKDNCQFFTNAIFNNNYSRLAEWDSITESTFDTGVVIVSNERIGILWVQDED
ncbi:hypothetical protein [Microseira sp. BLCC-F43]|jgi:hypothetical protein|uniref:hypothetical protein n=1 Tax=Microseira sp. BLCC-F43 TaxID=3153602 RepID=UPI0035B7DCC9